MRTKRWIISLACSVLLSACASNEPAPVGNVTAGAQGTPDNTVVVNVQSAPNRQNSGACREEAQTGSHFKRTRCMSEAERREVRDQAQEWMRTNGQFGATMTVQ